MKSLTLTVSQLNEYVRRSLAADPMLRNVCITGEISNFKRHVSGHWYFTLKDDLCRVSCVMFRTSAMRTSFRPKDGMMVIVAGRVSLYEATGAYQFYVDSMRPDGVGANRPTGPPPCCGVRDGRQPAVAGGVCGVEESMGRILALPRLAGIWICCSQYRYS